jgi:ADP-ribose pyrophosphatase
MDKPIVPHQIRKVFDGRVFTVQVESMTLPGGHRMDADIIRHPGSVVLIPVTEDGEVILVRQYRPAIARWVWELPAGTLKDGEDPARAAARECQEEIGLIPTNLERLGSLFPTPGYCDEEMNFYRATGLRAPREDDEAAHADEDEDLEPRPFQVAALRSMIADGEVIDMKTVAAMYWL